MGQNVSLEMGQNVSLEMGQTMSLEIGHTVTLKIGQSVEVDMLTPFLNTHARTQTHAHRHTDKQTH